MQVESTPLEKWKSEISAQPQASIGPTSQIEHIPLTLNVPKQPLNPKLFTREDPPYPDPKLGSPPRLPDLKENQRTSMDLDTDISTDFEENSPYQEGIVSEMYERPDKSYIREPPELGDLLDTRKLVQNFLPKQTDIDKILEIIERKVLKGTHLPFNSKRHPGWIFDKSIFQRFVSISGSE